VPSAQLQVRKILVYAQRHFVGLWHHFLSIRNAAEASIRPDLPCFDSPLFHSNHWKLGEELRQGMEKWKQLLREGTPACIKEDTQEGVLFALDVLKQQVEGRTIYLLKQRERRACFHRDLLLSFQGCQVQESLTISICKSFSIRS
jgi:hypothetical protein